MARHVAEELCWERLRFDEVNDPRMPLFLAHLPRNLRIQEYPGTPCPRMSLPDTWDGFLQTLSSATRQSLRSRIKKAEKAFTITRPVGDEAHASIEALVHMAVQRTRDNPDPNTARLESMLRRCATDGLAHILMMWKDQTPVAGVAGLIDRKKSSYGMYVTSFNEEFFDFSPGRVALAIAIRDAIDMSLSEFDFLRGEEPYKFQFGAVSGHNRRVLIDRRNLQGAVRRSVSGLRDLLRV
jgi:CelD/BcsL family acetyltransferase involved in cellulose biosynthesis